MNDDTPLTELLADPETHEAVRRATQDELEKIAWALREKRARVRGGGEPPAHVTGAYVTHGGSWIYPDADGLPSLLVDERIELDEPLG